MGDLRVAHEASDARILVTATGRVVLMGSTSFVTRTNEADAVASASARIGDPASAWETGVLSAVNRTAAKAGAAVGMTVRDAAARMLTARSPSR